MIRALVFDLDGLILDTESVVYASWQNAYLDHGVPLPLDLWHLAIGSDETRFEPLSYLLARRPDLDVEALQAQRRVVRDGLLSQLTACAGVVGALPGHAVAFEDSPNGVAAAVAAGMRCVAIPGPMTRGLCFDGAHLCFESLAKHSLDEILARVFPTPPADYPGTSSAGGRDGSRR